MLDNIPSPMTVSDAPLSTTNSDSCHSVQTLMFLMLSGSMVMIMFRSLVVCSPSMYSILRFFCLCAPCLRKHVHVDTRGTKRQSNGRLENKQIVGNNKLRKQRPQKKTLRRQARLPNPCLRPASTWPRVIDTVGGSTSISHLDRSAAILFMRRC